MFVKKTYLPFPDLFLECFGTSFPRHASIRVTGFLAPRDAKYFLIIVNMKKEDKKKVIADNQQHAKDTGSPKVQVAVLTQKIKDLTEHLKTHKKNKHSRRGLIGMVGRRRKLLMYMKMNDPQSYQQTVKDLGLRKAA